MIKKTLSQNKGFTLIELLVVIAIIGILLATGIVSYTRARLLARDTERHADVNQIRLALELYFGDIKQYPQSACDSGNPTIDGWQALSGANGLTSTINGQGPWANLIPNDPLNTEIDGYVYKYCTEAVNAYKISYKTEADGVTHLITKSGREQL